jgi:hypothetical protein
MGATQDSVIRKDLYEIIKIQLNIERVGWEVFHVVLLYVKCVCCLVFVTFKE